MELIKRPDQQLLIFLWMQSSTSYDSVSGFGLSKAAYPNRIEEDGTMVFNSFIKISRTVDD